MCGQEVIASTAIKELLRDGAYEKEEKRKWNKSFPSANPLRPTLGTSVPRSRRKVCLEPLAWDRHGGACEAALPPQHTLHEGVLVKAVRFSMLKEECRRKGSGGGPEREQAEEEPQHA